MNFNKLIPELSIKNIQESKKFYIEIIGFKIEYEREEDKFIFISLGEAQLMLEEINGYWETGELVYPFGRGVNFQIEVKNLEKIEKKLKENNVKLFREKKINFYKVENNIFKEKEILVQDPDGYLLRFSESV